MVFPLTLIEAEAQEEVHLGTFTLSVKSFKHSGMSRLGSRDAVSRTRSPEAERLLVSYEPSADTKKLRLW